MSVAERAPFALLPPPERGGTCPRCHDVLVVTATYLTGWRFFLLGRCEACGHRYLQDLPSGHGLVYPTTLDLSTGETFDPARATWFSEPLRALWEEPDALPVALSVTKHATTEEIVLVNCLDPVYGHSLHKLLNAQREIAQNPDRGVVVLVPQALAALVPDGVAEIWQVHERSARFANWLIDLDAQLGALLDRFERSFLSPAFPHPHPSTYSLAALVGHIAPRTTGPPSIVLALRDDRMWGEKAGDQAANVHELVERLTKSFASAGITAIGVDTDTPVPSSVLDLRDNRSNAERELQWLEILRGADLAIGVHGSNMLLPSGLAGATIELLPEDRYGNVLQATLLTQPDPLSAIARHRVVYGNAALSDVSAERVAAIAASMLRENDRFELMMRGAAAGETAGDVPMIPASPESPARPPPSRAPWQRGSTSSPRHLGAPLLRRVTGYTGALGRTIADRRLSQRTSRVGPAPAVLTDFAGLRFKLESASEIEAFLRHGGHFEHADLELAGRLLSPGMTVIDVGANIGFFTASFARRVDPGGRVFAIEPAQISQKRLEQTIALNDLTNVVPVSLALADVAGEAELYSYGPGFESWSTLAPREIPIGETVLQASGSSPVQTTTLDKFARERRLTSIDLVKLDVEGAELRVLEGAKTLLRDGRIHAVIVEVSDNTLEAFGNSAVELVLFLEQHGLMPHRLEGGRLVPTRIAGPHRTLTNIFALDARQRAAHPQLF